MHTPTEGSLQWAYNALSEYRQSLDIPFDDIDAFSKDSITVVLMGATQQGKTSLALRLLGAKPSDIPALDKALGGDTSVGESRTKSTSILTAVGKSDFQEKLDIVSKIVRENSSNPSDELRLDLPIKKGLVTRVIDLVGLESRSKKEQGIAEKQAQKWLQLADIKIVVVRASSITDIIIGNYSYTYNQKLKEIFGYWRVDPATSFIAVTFAWYDTEDVLFEKLTFNQLMNLEDCKVINTEMSKMLKDTLRNEYIKEKSNTAQDFPDVTILPFSLPPKINMNDSLEAKIFYATEHSLQVIHHRVETEQPLMFKLKSAFAFPLKIEKELLESRDRLLRGAKEYKEEKIKFEKDDKEDRDEYDKSKDDLEKIKNEKDYLDQLPNEIASWVRSRIKANVIFGYRFNRKAGLENKPWHRGSKKWLRMRLKDRCVHCIQVVKACVSDELRKMEMKYRRSNSSIAFNEIAPKYMIRKIILSGLSDLDVSIDDIEHYMLGKYNKNDSDWGKSYDRFRRFFLQEIDNRLIGIEKDLREFVKNSTEYQNHLKKIERSYNLHKENKFIVSEDNEKSTQARHTILNSKMKLIAGLSKEIELNRKKLSAARKYKEIICNSYSLYWNKRVQELNNEDISDNERINILTELYHSQKFFEEIRVFSSA